MNGSLTGKSVMGKGSTFWVELDVRAKLNILH